MQARSQKEQILSHLIDGKTITPKEALEKFSCFRVAARIADIKKMGYEISREMVKAGGAKVAKYSLKKAEA